MRRDGELNIELLTGVLMIIVLVLALIKRIDDGLAMGIGGLILIGSALYQSRQGWHVSWVTWAVGILLLLGGIGVNVFLVAHLRINYVAVGLVIIGGYLLWRWVSVRG